VRYSNFPSIAYSRCAFIKIVQSPEPGLGTATASLLIAVSINGYSLYLTISINGFPVLGGHNCFSHLGLVTVAVRSAYLIFLRKII
jgi:hypothetical protein